ncbi:MAG: TolC family protein [Verrucomicrobia bacterium]|nr:TolC family protein [Verrucomicrobiota bacterium]
MQQKPLSKHLFYLGLVASVTLPLAAARPPRNANEPRSAASREAGDGALSLDRALRLALANNPNLQASAARKEAANGRAVQARAWPNPELEISSQDMPPSRGGFSKAKNMAGISQVVPYPGKKQADIEIGTADAAAGTASWRLNRTELVREVKIAFYQIQTAERTATVVDDLVRVAQAASTAAGKRNAAGEITLQEQLRAEIQLEQTQTEKVDAVREATVARQELAMLIGRPDLRDARLTGAPDEAGDPVRLGRAPSAWLAGHPAMVAARARRDQAVATLRRAGLEPRPDVKVGLAGGRDESAEENLMELRFTIPLPLFDRNKGKQQEAQAGVREAEAGIMATEQRLIASWRAATARYQAAVKQVTAHRERILPKSEAALHLVQTGFEEGKFGFIDLLDIQRTTAEARMAYQKKLFELNAARADLEAMTEPVPASSP